jgi:diguanylate cyclase (GGDEF)-like protein/PAS domain S-box-containing protein
MQRIFTAQRVRDLPFLVVTGEAYQTLLAAWWQKLWTLTLTWLVIAGLGLLVLRSYLRTLRYDRELLRSHRSLEEANQTLSQEIHERQEAERAIKSSEERFRALFDNSLSGVAVHDIILNDQGEPCDYVFTMANPAFESHTGMKVADVVGRRATDIYPVPELPGLIRRFGEVALTGRAIAFEQHLESVGEYYSVGAFQIGPGSFAAIIDNITARKQTEMDLQRSEEKYRFLVQNSYDIIYLFSPDGHIEFVSPSWKTLMGHDPESILGRHFSEFVHPEDLPICQRAFANVMRHGHHAQDIEYRVRHRDGGWRWHNSSALPSRDETGQITGFQGIARDITARKQAEDEIKTLAFYDSLTQLPNRRLLIERLEATVQVCRRDHHHGALLFIDLDNFKILNDTLGHDQGDRLLMQAARRISGCVHEADTVARLGGDEFVVMLCKLSQGVQEATQQAEIVADKILAALNHPYYLSGREHHSTASVGITLFHRDLVSVDELMKRADLAMYQAKAAGRNTHRLFDPGMQASVTARAALENDLRRALAEDQFLLHYQVLVDDNGQLTGAEALLRWQHPERGLVPPGEFITLAEDTGLILPLGQWVLETACGQLARWAQDPTLKHLKIAANVSARQFRHSDFVAGVLSALASSGADPHRLKLEITESLLLEDVEEVIEKMRQLRARGISFALDDFGTGYSSLSYLKRLPLDDVKIDQSFVRDVLIDPNDAAIARTIVALADTLGLRVIAEGVETREHWEWLSRHGCHTHQGYYFGRPGPVTSIQAALANWTFPSHQAGPSGAR